MFVGDAHSEEQTYPRARFVGFAALAMQDKARREVEPTYLRSSQAERLKQKTRSQEA